MLREDFVKSSSEKLWTICANPVDGGTRVPRRAHGDRVPGVTGIVSRDDSTAHRASGTFENLARARLSRVFARRRKDVLALAGDGHAILVVTEPVYSAYNSDACSSRTDDRWPHRLRAFGARGKSELHRAVCWLTTSPGNRKESATENIPPLFRRLRPSEKR